MRSGWGSDDPAYREFFTSRLIADATPEQRRWLTDLARISTSPDNVVRINQATLMRDVRGLAKQLTVPTLVFHGRGDRTPYARSRDFAAAVPDAQFVLLETANHILVEGEPAWDVFLDELRRFLGVGGPA